MTVLPFAKKTGPRHKARLFSLSLIFILVTLLLGCGGSTNSGSQLENEFKQVIGTDTVYSVANLENIGYKVSKSYDVEGLVGSLAAYYGFWQPPSSNSPVDFEVRVYESHDVAVASGTAQAEEATGDDAVLDRAESSWPEGLTDRRRVVGPGASQGTGQPRYPDYVIVGNLVVLCEGRNLEHARQLCAEFVAALHP